MASLKLEGVKNYLVIVSFTCIVNYRLISKGDVSLSFWKIIWSPFFIHIFFLDAIVTPVGQ